MGKVSRRTRNKSVGTTPKSKSTPGTTNQIITRSKVKTSKTNINNVKAKVSKKQNRISNDFSGIFNSSTDSSVQIINRSKKKKFKTSTTDKKTNFKNRKPIQIGNKSSGFLDSSTEENEENSSLFNDKLDNTNTDKKTNFQNTKPIQIDSKSNGFLDSAIEENEENSSPSNEKLESTNNVESDMTVVINNSYEIIDISDSTIDNIQNANTPSVSSKINQLNIENNMIDIINLTDTTIVENESKNYQTVSSNETISIDDVQIISGPSLFQKKPIEVIVIDDSDDEKPVVRHKSIKERLGISACSKNIQKKKYNSPLHRHRTILKGVNMARNDNYLPFNLGPFVIDNQKISQHRNNVNKKELKNSTKMPSLSSQPHNSLPTTTSKVTRQLRPIVIDGLNIGHAYGSGIFSAKGIELCIKYFADRGHKDILAFIPQHRQGPPGSESNIIFNELVKKGHICWTPSRKVQNLRMTCYDDRIILNHAHRCGGVVVSNDNYRDLYEESEAFKEIIENRQVMVTFARGEIIVPDDQYNRKSDIRSLSDILCFPA